MPFASSPISSPSVEDDCVRRMKKYTKEEKKKWRGKKKGKEIVHREKNKVCDVI
jgi:hypothetical protein